MEGGRWLGHDKYRDLPLLGIDPDASLTWEPVDDGRRPDNRDPRTMVAGKFGIRPDIGPVGERVNHVYGDGRELMAYHRALAQSYEDARKSVGLVETVY